MAQVQSRSSPIINAKDGELVLAAGGIKGYGHIGALMALRDFEMTFRKVTGVSVGSIIATFITNGYTPEQILEIFESSVEQRFSVNKLLQLFNSTPDPVSIAIGGFMDLYPAVRDMVEQYKLKPNEQLRMVACNLFKHQPVVFEFRDGQFDTDAAAYDALAHAITSSCSLPGVFRPQWHRQNGELMLLGDGAVYHYNPTEFCSGAATVIRFNQVTELPRELTAPWNMFGLKAPCKDCGPSGAASPWEFFTRMPFASACKEPASNPCVMPSPMSTGFWSAPFDLYFSIREIYFPLAGNQRYVDETKHLVIDIGLPDVAGLYMGAPADKRRALVDNGKTLTTAALKRAAEEGRLIGAKVPE